MKMKIKKHYKINLAIMNQGEEREGEKGPWKLAGKRGCGGWEPGFHAGVCTPVSTQAWHSNWGCSVDHNKLQNVALSKGGSQGSTAANSWLVGMLL